MSKERTISITGPHEIPKGGWSIIVGIDQKKDQIYALEFDTEQEASSVISRFCETLSKDPSSILR